MAESKPKRFIPLENNPEVMTSLLHKLGLSPQLQFHDVFSIDDKDLLAFVPRPALALLLVFPVSSTYEAHRASEDSNVVPYTSTGEAEGITWYRQTIGNACGLIGLLHAVSNGPARKYIQAGSELEKLVTEASKLGPEDRAKLLERSDELEQAHAAAANTGDTAAPAAEESVELHFVCFVRGGKEDGEDAHLFEMDGRRKGPIDRGMLPQGEDVLSDEALRRGVRAFLKREEEAGGGELRFSLLVLAEGFD